MKFAPFQLWQCPAGRNPQEVIIKETELAVKAEEMGYDGVFIAEHHFCGYSPSGAPEVALGYMAGKTKRIKLGMAVSVLPLHHPLTLAEEWATADVYSEGRLEFGVGRRYNYFAFDSMGIDLLENTAPFVEALEILKLAWTGERFDYDGKFHTIKDTQVLPTPVQKPHPRMWYASIRKESVRMAANLGLGSCAVFDASPQDLIERRELWETTARRAGRSEEWIRDTLEHTPNQRIVWVADTDRQAQEECRAMLQSFAGLAELCAWPGTGFAREIPESAVDPGYRQRLKQGWLEARFDWETLTQNYSVLAGSPQTVRRQIEELTAQFPMEYMLMWTSIGGPSWEAQEHCLKLFADKVMPHFK